MGITDNFVLYRRGTFVGGELRQARRVTQHTAESGADVTVVGRQPHDDRVDNRRDDEPTRQA